MQGIPVFVPLSVMSPLGSVLSMVRVSVEIGQGTPGEDPLPGTAKSVTYAGFRLPSAAVHKEKKRSIPASPRKRGVSARIPEFPANWELTSVAANLALPSSDLKILADFL